MVLWLGLGALGGSAHAEQMMLALGEQDFFAELPVVLSAARLPQEVADVPAAVTIIDRQMIEAAGVADIPSLFRLVAGFQVAHDKDGRVAATYHGASDSFARRMQVMVDGRSVYTPFTGGVDWVNLPVSLEDIARIEVARGPNGVAYGANAFFGVINIITFHPSEVRGYSFKGILGDAGFRKGTLRYAGNSGDLDYRVTVEHRETSGFRDVDIDTDILDGRRSTALTLRGDYRATTNDYLTFHLGHISGPRERGYLDSIHDPARQQQDSGNFQQVRWKRIHSSSEEFNIQFYRNYQRYSDHYAFDWPGPPAPMRIDADLDIRTERYNLEFEHLLAPSPDWRLMWGGEMRIERCDSPGLLGNPDTFEHHLYRLFTNAEWHPGERWTANIGALVEHNEFNHAQTSPRLALNYRLEGGRYLRGSYTEAWRTPSLFEEKADYAARLAEETMGFPAGTAVDQLYFSDGGLAAEHMASYELAFGGISASQRLSYEFKLFREELRDLIAIYRDEVNPQGDFLENGVYRFANDGAVTLRGIEVQGRIQPNERSLISIGYSYTRASGYSRNEVVSETEYAYQDMAAATPRHTLGLLLAGSSRAGWGASLGVYHVSDMDWLSGDPTRYTTADLSLRKQFKGPAGEGAAFFTVRDFLDAYYDHANNIYQERRVYFGVEMRVR